jgi:hypothetical protein
MLTGFFKLYKPKTYQYRPIYYDPLKEAQQKREEQLKAKKENPDTRYKTSITRGTFREYADKNKTARRSLNRRSNIRVIAILGILLLIAYYLIR